MKQITTISDCICERVIADFPALQLFPETVRDILEQAATVLSGEGVPMQAIAHWFLTSAAIHSTLATLSYTKLTEVDHWQC